MFCHIKVDIIQLWYPLKIKSFLKFIFEIKFWTYPACILFHNETSNSSKPDGSLVVGGGSALLPSPKVPITLSEMASLTRLMSQSGATITQLNTVRKNLEILKGGGLARACHPAKVWECRLLNNKTCSNTFILSQNSAVHVEF